MARLQTSRLLTVALSSSSLYLCWLFYGLDFARTGTSGPMSAKTHDIGDISYIVGMVCGGGYLAINARHTFRGARHMFLIASVAMALITVLCSTAIYQSPGMVFNICRLCQGTAAGVSSGLALMMIASTAKHKNVGWTMFVPALSILFGYNTGCAVPHMIDLHRFWPMLVIPSVLVGVAGKQLRHESELNREPEETIVGLHDSIDEKNPDWRRPFEQAPLLIQSIGRALIFSYALSGSIPTSMGGVWTFNISDDMWEDWKSAQGNSTVPSMNPSNNTTVSISGSSSPPFDDNMEQEIRHFTTIFFNLIFFSLTMFVPSFFETVGAFTYKRWGLKYHSLVAIALGLPGAIVSWWFRGQQQQQGLNAIETILRLATTPFILIGTYILTVLTPIVAQFANSTYGLSVGIRTRAFAYFVCAIGLGLLLRFVKWINLSKIPFLGESGVLMVCMACVDLLPDAVQKLKAE